MQSYKYRFSEPFTAFDEKNTPVGLYTEINSVYTHQHSRRENGIFYITCPGAKFICKTPDLKNIVINASVCFHNCEGRRSFSLYFGYDLDHRTGYACEFLFDSQIADVRLIKTDRLEFTVLSDCRIACDVPDRWMCVQVAVSGDTVSGNIDENPFSLKLPETYTAGKTGIAITCPVGELAVNNISVESSDDIVYEKKLDTVKAELSLQCGGTMPYSLSYSITKLNGYDYLDYSFDGGEQYRDKYHDYPRHTGQYSVEKHKFLNPYLTLMDSSFNDLFRIPVYTGEFMTADPGLVWKVLIRYFNIIKLPLSGSCLIPNGVTDKTAYIGFGCESQSAAGYKMQSSRNHEEVFDLNSGKPVYSGISHGVEHIEVCSDSRKTTDRIPLNVYDYETVIDHLKNNHFFDETEEIIFTARFVSDKNYVSIHAVLCDVFGDEIGDFSAEQSGEKWRFCHSKLPIGVYRIRCEVFYGDSLYMKREVTFEVYDSTGIKCAPLESGLPFLFSMPNEQKYLDRDAFDMYNPSHDCNMEHYYSASGMPGDIGIRKRIWETNKLFGRKWYVWDSSHRTLTEDEFKLYGEELIRRSDYCYYPVPYEWAVMRHDPLNTVAYSEGFSNAAGNYGSGIMGYLRDFLNLNPDIDIGLGPDDKSITQNQLSRLLSGHIREWLDYANRRINEDFRNNTEWMRKINPDIKRACYGPFNLYGGPIFTHHGCRYIGFEPETSLSEYMFDGFAQLEDYPYSCTYHTYQGAFFVANILLHHPDLNIYPEEYTASDGGCIDGAVKDAHPPLGKYDMQPYFNVTHSYEYVYNTAHLTTDGFSYWKNRGFMQRDFTEEFTDEFIRGWKNVVNFAPDRPMRSIAYLSEVPKDEDEWNGYLSCVSNQSNAGLGYVYQTSRLSGIPNGFTVSRDSLMTLTPEMTDCLVLTSLKHADDEMREKIRELYNSGVSLIAVSDVSGLDDIFGVRKCPKKHNIYKLSDSDGNHERIFPNEAEFMYQPEDAEILLSASGDEGKSPVLMRKDRALIINANIDKLGCQTYGIRAPNYYAANISKLLGSSLGAAMKLLTAPVCESDCCGITLLKDKKGRALLLAIDYSDYDLADKDRRWESTISFNIEVITGIETLYGDKPIILRENGGVKKISISLHQQECALFMLNGI